MAARTVLSAVLLACAGSLLGAVPPSKELKDLAFGKRPAQARALFESTVPDERPLGPEWLEAMSWVGRAGVIGEDWSLAAEFAETTYEGCQTLLRSRDLEADPNGPLAIALGASIETLAKFYDAQGDRGRAVLYLRDQLRNYGDTSIATRLNKNLLLLDLAGKPMPALESAKTVGAVPLDAEALRGNVTLFFFWAHWCSDCRAQKPVLGELAKRYAASGFRVVAPTRLYGYVKRGTDVGPNVELRYIEKSHLQADALLRTVPVPLSGKNFVDFGVSTTPTLVLVDRGGTVRLYHPGEMSEAELERQIEALL